MRIFASVLTASLLLAASASAQAPISDEHYVQMARCAGLKAGARQDASIFDAVVRSSSAGRARGVRNAAAAQRRSAAEQMRRADDALKSQLEAEISTRCVSPVA